MYQLLVLLNLPSTSPTRLIHRGPDGLPGSLTVHSPTDLTARRASHMGMGPLLRKEADPARVHRRRVIAHPAVMIHTTMGILPPAIQNARPRSPRRQTREDLPLDPPSVLTRHTVGLAPSGWHVMKKGDHITRNDRRCPSLCVFTRIDPNRPAVASGTPYLTRRHRHGRSSPSTVDVACADHNHTHYDDDREQWDEQDVLHDAARLDLQQSHVVPHLPADRNGP